MINNNRFTIITNRCGNGGTRLLNEMYNSSTDTSPSKFYNYYNLIISYKKEPHLFYTFFSGINSIFIDGFYFCDESKLIIPYINNFINKQNSIIRTVSIQISYYKNEDSILNDIQLFDIKPQTIKIDYPNLESREQIISNIFAYKNITINRSIQTFLANLKFNSVRELKNSVECIIALAEINNLNLKNILFNKFIETFCDALINLQFQIGSENMDIA